MIAFPNTLLDGIRNPCIWGASKTLLTYQEAFDHNVGGIDELDLDVANPITINWQDEFGAEGEDPIEYYYNYILIPIEYPYFPTYNYATSIKTNNFIPMNGTIGGQTFVTAIPCTIGTVNYVYYYTMFCVPMNMYFKYIP